MGNGSRESSCPSVEEFKYFDAFETNTAAATIGACNLEFDDYKKKVTNFFPSIDLHQITPTGKLEEGEEEDEED